ncbi:phosphoglucomutase [Clostridia bacterium]|nr:phosphoglucomutase [Clostridia bacterium]
MKNVWLSKAVDDPDLIPELQSVWDDAEAVNDRFYRELEFGTGGLRGVIGAGTNRMNIYTVRQATQGLADYINGNGVVKKVAIGHDSRNKSALFAREAARVLAANGIQPWLYNRLVPTPVVSWGVRHLQCGAGICVTASHNPAIYNGYKVYGADGCQITTDAASKIQAAIKSVDPFAVKVADTGINTVPEQTLDAFIEAVLAQRVESAAPAALKVVYTPLNGAGLECVTRALKAAGYADVHVVPSQEKPDGNFPTCPYPNPEERAAMAEGLKLCAELTPDLLIATDPDCDRVGIAVVENGDYKLLTGNEVGALLLDYICRRRLELNRMPKNPVAVKTIVTSELTARVAEHYNVELRDVLTGFKFIGEQIGLLEAAGEANRYIFGFEESYGYLSGPHVRDKDAVNASLMICDMAAWYKSQNITLAAALDDLYARFGYCANSLDSFAFPGEAGLKDMQNVMKSLRSAPPKAIQGYIVTEFRDYITPFKPGFPSSDVLQLLFEDGTLITARPSGTEPKLKIYYSVTREDAEAAKAVTEDYRKAVKRVIGL